METDINFVISNTFDNDHVLRVGFERGLVSAGTLAKHIVSMHPDKELNQESVRTAVRRLKRGANTDKSLLKKAHGILADSYLHVRSNMVKVEFEKDEATLQILNSSFKLNEIYNTDLFRLVKGHSVFHAVVEESNLEKIKEIFDGKIRNIQNNLCEFIIIFPFEGRETPGVLLTLTSELSMNGVNVVQAFSCGEEINIIVDEKNNQKAYNLLTNLFKRCKVEAS